MRERLVFDRNGIAAKVSQNASNSNYIRVNLSCLGQSTKGSLLTILKSVNIKVKSSNMHERVHLF